MCSFSNYESIVGQTEFICLFNETSPRERGIMNTNQLRSALKRIAFASHSDRSIWM